MFIAFGFRFIPKTLDFIPIYCGESSGMFDDMVFVYILLEIEMLGKC